MTTIEKLKALVTYLSISPRKIQSDPNWGSVIKGKRGFIRVQNGYWIAVVKGMSRRYSSSVRRKLDFMSMGSLLERVDNPLSDAPAVRTMEFKLDRIPTGPEATVIRKVLGLDRKRVLSEEAKRALVERLSEQRLRKASYSEEPAQEAPF